MAVAYKGAGSGAGTETNGAALNLSCPATVDANDILIAHVIYLNNSTQPTTPEGWTRLYTTSGLGAGLGTGTPTGRAYVYGKIAVGNEDGTTISFGTAGGTAGRYGRIYSFSGWVSGTLSDVVPAASFADTPSETDPFPPNITTTVTGSLAVALVAQDDNNSIGSFTGESGGNWTEAVAEYVSTSIGAQGCMCQLQTAIPTNNPGTITGGTYNTSNDENSTIVFEIRPNTPNSPPTVELNTPTDEEEISDLTPDLTFTGTDPEGESIEYEIQIDTVNTFDSVREEVLIASQETTYVATTFDSYQKFVGQSFTGTTGTLYKYVSKLRIASGTPTGNLVARLYSHAGTYGTSSCGSTLLATSDNVDVSTLSSTAADINFNFSGSERYSLVGGTYYVIGVFYEAVGGTIQTYVANGDVCTGNSCSINSFNNWNYISSQDIYFKVYTANKTPLIDKFSTTDAGFVNLDNGADTHPFTSGQEVTYTVQSALEQATYYWRVRALDPSGTNTWGDWSSPVRSFTITGTAASSDRLLYTKGGKAVVSSDRLLYTRGKLTNSSDRLLYTAGAGTSDRLLYTKGISTDSSERLLYTKGSLTDSSERLLYTKGGGTGSSDRLIYSDGVSTDISERLIYSEGSVNADSDRGVYTKGIAIGSSERQIYSKGFDTDSSDRLLYSKGGVAGGSDRLLYSKGSSTGGSDRGLYIQGRQTSYTDSLLYIEGKETGYADIGLYLSGGGVTYAVLNLYIEGYEAEIVERGLWLAGVATGYSDANLYLQGKLTSYSDVNLYLEGRGVESVDRLLYITGIDTGYIDMGLYLQGRSSPSVDRLLYLEGQGVSYTETGLYLVGKALGAADIGLWLTGYEQTYIDRGLWLAGYAQSYKDVNLYLEGCVQSYADTNLYLAGIDSGYADRGIYIRGDGTIYDEGMLILELDPGLYLNLKTGKIYFKV